MKAVLLRTKGSGQIQKNQRGGDVEAWRLSSPEAGLCSGFGVVWARLVQREREVGREGRAGTERAEELGGEGGWGP